MCSSNHSWTRLRNVVPQSRGPYSAETCHSQQGTLLPSESVRQGFLPYQEDNCPDPLRQLLSARYDQNPWTPDPSLDCKTSLKLQSGRPSLSAITFGYPASNTSNVRTKFICCLPGLLWVVRCHVWNITCHNSGSPWKIWKLNIHFDSGMNWLNLLESKTGKQSYMPLCLISDDSQGEVGVQFETGFQHLSCSNINVP